MTTLMAYIDLTTSRILCSTGHYAPMSDFSNNAINKYKQGKSRGKPAVVSCKRHTVGSVQELLCEVCDRIRPIHEFSNASRKTNNTTRCRDCVSWFESDTSGSIPLPAPLEQRAPDETELISNPYNDDDGGLDEIGNGFNVLTIRDDCTDFTGRSIPVSGDDNGNKLTGSTLNTGNDRDAATSHGSVAYNPSSAPSVRSDPMSFRRVEHSRQPQTKQYLAYGPNGQVQPREQSVISTSDAASITTAKTAASQKSKGFAKVSGRKAPLVAPGYMTTLHPDEPKRYYRFEDGSGSDDEC